MTPPRVVVVGGGLAGLAAAVACRDAGADVTLLEARPRLGGAATSFRRGDLTVDTGQHVFLRCCTAYRGFLRRLGTDRLAPVQPRLEIPVLHDDGRRATLRRGRLPAPLHLAAALARYRLLSPADRLRVARGAAALRRRGRGRDDTTFGAWLRAHGQNDATVAALWDLFTVPTLNLPADEASVELAAFVFRTGLLERADAGDIGLPAVPLAELHAEPAAAVIGDVRTATRVTAVGPGPTVTLATRERLTADAVVVAVPPDDAAALVGYPHAGALGAVPIVNVHVVYDRPVTALPFAAGVGTPVQWFFDRTTASGARGGQYLAVSVSAATADCRERAAALAERYVEALARLLPAARSARVIDRFVTREREATFRQRPGVGAYRPGPATAIPRVFLAGAWTDTGWPATMEGAVRSGQRAARAALAAAGRPSARPAEEAAA